MKHLIDQENLAIGNMITAARMFYGGIKLVPKDSMVVPVRPRIKRWWYKLIGKPTVVPAPYIHTMKEYFFAHPVIIQRIIDMIDEDKKAHGQ